MKCYIILIGFWVWLAYSPTSVFANASENTQTESADSQALKKLFEEDQADRQNSTDPFATSRHDDEHETRVKVLYNRGALKTGADYYRAAMILQHAVTPDDFLLCHDFCIVAISKGEQRAKWLAAASMDRFLVNIGRPQRFGTQYAASRPGFPIYLRPVDASVTDQLRSEFSVAPLAVLKEREAKMDARFGKVILSQKNEPNQAPEPTPTTVTPPAGQEARQP